MGSTRVLNNLMVLAQLLFLQQSINLGHVLDSLTYSLSGRSGKGNDVLLSMKHQFECMNGIKPFDALSRQSVRNSLLHAADNCEVCKNVFRYKVSTFLKPD